MNSYELAQKYRMLSIDEVDLIKSCVAKLPEHPKIINIGANIGTSTCAMLEANSNAFVFSLDSKPCPEEKENLIKCGLPANQVLRVLGDSTKIDTRFWPFFVDMVFVDGSHTIDDVTRDCENWKPFTRRFILFHDFQHPNYIKNGVNEFDDTVRELMKDWRWVGQARYLVAFEKKWYKDQVGKVKCEGCDGTGRIIGRQGMGVLVDHTGCSGRGWVREADDPKTK